METKFSVNLLTNLQVTMDKKTSKDAEKKTDRVKDRGDLRKINNNTIKAKDSVASKNFMPDRGDSQIANQKSVKPSTEKKKPEDIKRNCDLSKKEPKKEDVPVQIKTYLDSEGRKRLRERYTLKLNTQNLSKNLEVKDKLEAKENDKQIEKKTDDESAATTGNESSQNSVYTEPRSEKKLAKETPCSQRKPIIKTVTFKNDNRVYKAVTFVDQKQHTPLQINIPNEYKKKVKDKEPSLKVKLKPSKESVPVTVKPKKVKKRGKKRILSPELFTRGKSPPTEVAKWAPSCINHHTKPYYEAWVDTTLAAISKSSNKDKHYFEKQNIIQTFHKALLERPDTPDLMYENYNDERYTGKIKIRQR